MIKTLNVDDVKVGMYVILPWKLLRNPFAARELLIESEKQLKELRETGFGEVRIDTSKSRIVKEVECATHPRREAKPPKEWNPTKNISKALSHAIQDQALSPEEKAKAVYQNSLELMQGLFETPTAECIMESKKAIGRVVDLVLSDDDTALNLLRITSHDFYTYTHSVNTGVLCVSLAKRLYGASTDIDMHELGAGFFLHDLGKVGISSEILNKPGPLDDREMRKMRTHPGQGYNILKKTGQLSPECAIIAQQHHEREDGTGYPRGLRGDDIHDYARICCIADVFDALTAERSYKEGLPTRQALQIMKEQMIDHFQEEIFENFVMLFQT